MTRKDYILIANAIKREHQDAVLMGKQCDPARLALVYLAKRLSVELKEDNPRFNSEAFYNACFS